MRSFSILFYLFQSIYEHRINFFFSCYKFHCEWRSFFLPSFLFFSFFLFSRSFCSPFLSSNSPSELNVLYEWPTLIRSKEDDQMAENPFCSIQLNNTLWSRQIHTKHLRIHVILSMKWLRNEVWFWAIQHTRFSIEIVIVWLYPSTFLSYLELKFFDKTSSKFEPRLHSSGSLLRFIFYFVFTRHDTTRHNTWKRIRK